MSRIAEAYGNGYDSIELIHGAGDVNEPVEEGRGRIKWELRRLGTGRRVVVVLTRVLVDPLDPRRLEFSKPIGGRVTEQDATARADDRHRYAAQPGGGPSAAGAAYDEGMQWYRPVSASSSVIGCP